MSGPIVRKYGFPNFEKIFGERPILHGEPAAEQPPATSETEAQAPKAQAKPKTPKSKKSKE